MLSGAALYISSKSTQHRTEFSIRRPGVVLGGGGGGGGGDFPKEQDKNIYISKKNYLFNYWIDTHMCTSWILCDLGPVLLNTSREQESQHISESS